MKTTLKKEYSDFKKYIKYYNKTTNYIWKSYNKIEN